MKRIVSVLAVLLFCAGAFANELPRIAVYVTGNVGDDNKKALGTKMLASLINSKRYKGIERSNSFLAEIEKEQVKQRSGEIDDSQISELGRQFGVKFVCIADITPVLGEFQVSARIVDVETAEVVFIGESTSPLKTISDLTQVAAEVVKNMFDEQSKPEQRPEPKPQTALDVKPAPEPPPAASQAKPEPAKPKPRPTGSAEKKPVKFSLWGGITLDVLGAGIIAYGLLENENVVKSSEAGEYGKAEISVKNRDMLYIAGAAVLLAGISVHIFF